MAEDRPDWVNPRQAAEQAAAEAVIRPLIDASSLGEAARKAEEELGPEGVALLKRSLNRRIAEQN